MNLVNQPDKQSLGFKLIENLENEGFMNFRFIVAYAKTSGISTLQPSMKKFRDAGGTIKGMLFLYKIFRGLLSFIYFYL